MAERSKAPDSRDRLLVHKLSFLVHECGRGFESHFWQYFLASNASVSWTQQKSMTVRNQNRDFMLYRTIFLLLERNFCNFFNIDPKSGIFSGSFLGSIKKIEKYFEQFCADHWRYFIFSNGYRYRYPTDLKVTVTVKLLFSEK